MKYLKNLTEKKTKNFLYSFIIEKSIIFKKNFYFIFNLL